MSPKSPMKEGLASPAEAVSTELKEIKRDPIFTRHDRPFGFEQETFNAPRHIVIHIFAVYMTYLNITGQVPWSVLLIEIIYGLAGGLGITLGVHRYWTHKSYKANLPLQTLLMVLNTIAHQQPIHKWCLDHRIHHKYTDTAADPHNSKRGFWFCHMGWLFMPKTEELKKKLKTFDVSDLENDPVVRFQSKWFWTLILIFFYVVPMSLTYYIWRLPLLYLLASTYRRYVMSLHCTWCVNSFAHMYGDKPYDTSITPAENPIVAILAAGEGWHNYHHTFPWDYKTSEFGWKLNMSTMFIDFFAAIGWAWDLKSVSPKMLKERLQRTGAGVKKDTDSAAKSDLLKDFTAANDVTEYMNSMDTPLWGWDDESLPEAFRNATKILSPGLF